MGRAARWLRSQGRKIIVYGVLTDGQGRPVAVEVYEGHRADPTTVTDPVEKLREQLGLDRVVLVGDRGMWTEAQIGQLRKHRSIGWVSALRAQQIQPLAEGGTIQMSLFDEQNWAEIRTPQYPGERLVVCYNPVLAEQRARRREELLAATDKELNQVAEAVARMLAADAQPPREERIPHQVRDAANRVSASWPRLPACQETGECQGFACGPKPPRLRTSGLAWLWSQRRAVPLRRLPLLPESRSHRTHG